MRKWLHIITVIFCLGSLIIPNQTLAYTSSKQTSCCESSQKNNCCDEDKKTDSHQDCKDQCCTMCHSCSHSFVFKSEKIGTAHLLFVFQNKKVVYPYTTPFVYSISHQIWQPPKIA